MPQNLDKEFCRERKKLRRALARLSDNLYDANIVAVKLPNAERRVLKSCSR